MKFIAVILLVFSVYINVNAGYDKQPYINTVINALEKMEVPVFGQGISPKNMKKFSKDFFKKGTQGKIQKALEELSNNKVFCSFETLDKGICNLNVYNTNGKTMNIFCKRELGTVVFILTSPK